MFSKHKADTGCYNFAEHAIELEGGFLNGWSEAHETPKFGGMPGGKEKAARIGHNRTLEVTLGWCGRHGQKKGKTAKILLQFLLPEPVIIKDT